MQLVVAACALALGVLAPATASASYFSWSSPALIDHQKPYAYPGRLVGVSCPTATLCVALDDVGRLFASGNPTGGEGAWTPVARSNATRSAIACPSQSLCVAVGADAVMVSSDPTGAGTWVSHSVEQPYDCYHDSCNYYWLAAISCPSASLCVAVDSGGQVLTSTNPAGDASTWRTALVDSGHSLAGVSCASASLCAAVDDSGQVLISTDPSGGGAWRAARVDGTNKLAGISCPSAALCVAVDAAGNAVVSSDPAADAAAWQVANIDGANALSAVSCQSPSLCAAVDKAGGVLTSTSPAAGQAQWQRASVDGANALSGVTCQSAPLCVAVDAVGNVLASSDPAGGAGAWAAAYIDSGDTNGPSAIACPSATLCVAVDRSGNVVTSTDPSFTPGSWSVAHVDGINAINAISCPSSSLCVAVDAAGNVITSTDPARGAAAWTVTKIESAPAADGYGPQGIVTVSCPSVALCLVTDTDGNVRTSTNPAGGPAAWRIARARNGEALGGEVIALTCPSVSLCLDGDGTGRIFASTDPRSGFVGWRIVWDGTVPINALSCPSASRCVAITNGGEIVTSTDPSRRGSWTARRALVSGSEAGSAPTAISCPSVAVCVAVDSEGGVYVSDPASGYGTWQRTAADRGNALEGIACPLVSVCVAVDEAGNALRGHALGPANIARPRVAGRAVQGAIMTEIRGTWTGSPQTFSHQWERCDLAGASCTVIGHGKTYRPRSRDVGHTIRVEETATNARGPGVPASSAPTRAVIAAPISRVAASLRSQLIPRGAGSSISALLRKGSYAGSFKALTPGKLVIRWYLVPRGARLSAAKPRPLLVGSGSKTFTDARASTIKIALTAAGEGQLRNTRRISITTQGVFVPLGRGRIVATAMFTLTR